MSGLMSYTVFNSYGQAQFTAATDQDLAAVSALYPHAVVVEGLYGETEYFDGVNVVPRIAPVAQASVNTAPADSTTLVVIAPVPDEAHVVVSHEEYGVSQDFYMPPDDPSLELSFSIPGRYIVQIKAPVYLDQEIIIDAT